MKIFTVEEHVAHEGSELLYISLDLNKAKRIFNREPSNSYHFDRIELWEIELDEFLALSKYGESPVRKLIDYKPK